MINDNYKGYANLGEIFIKYAVYDYDQKLIDFLMSECCQFLFVKRIKPEVFKHFTIEFDIRGDNSYVGLKGGNLMSSLWLIDVYPPSPEKYIQDNTCIFNEKKYIYDLRGKSLKIIEYATKRH